MVRFDENGELQICVIDFTYFSRVLGLLVVCMKKVRQSISIEGRIFFFWKDTKTSKSFMDYMGIKVYQNLIFRCYELSH